MIVGLYQHFFASSNFYSANNLQHNIEAIVQSENNDIEFFVNIGNNLNFDYSNSLMFSLYAGNLFNNVYSPAYRIYGNAEIQNQFFLDSTAQNSKAFLSSLNLEYSHRPDQNISYNTGINLTNENNLIFVLNDFTFNESIQTIENIQNEIYESVDGTYGEFFTGLFIRLFNSLEQNFYFRYKGLLVGDEIYEKVMQRFPKNKFYYSLVYTPFKDLTGSLNLTYTTSQEWIEYRNITVDDDNIYLNKISNRLLLNIAITKGFWKNRILLSTVFENLLNERIQFHPVGSTTDLTFYLKLKVLLESVIEI